MTSILKNANVENSENWSSLSGLISLLQLIITQSDCLLNDQTFLK